MEERQRGSMSNVDENNGAANRDERHSSFQMAALRRQYADREQLEVELARRRSADIIASARQNARESIERSRQQIQGIRHRWDVGSQLPSASQPQGFQNAVFGQSSEPRVGQSRMPEFLTNLGRSGPAEGVFGQSWGNRPSQVPPSIAHVRDRRSQNEGLLLNSSTYFRIQIDHAASSSNFRSRAELTLPPACTSWTNAGRAGTRAGHSHQRRYETSAQGEATDGHADVTSCHHPGIRAGRYTQLPVLGLSGHRALRETASFVSNPSCPSERYHCNPRLRTSYIGLSRGNGFYEPAALASSNENGLAKETYQDEIPTSDAFRGHYSPPENYLTELSGLPTGRHYRLCEDVDQSRLPMIVVSSVRGSSEENYRRELPASYPGQDIRPSGAERSSYWNPTVGADNEEEKNEENRDTEPDTSGILASLSDMEQFIQKIEEGIDLERKGATVEGSDSPVQPEDLCTLWQVIAECEAVAKAVEDAGDFDAGETLYEWSLERMDKLSTACYRFVVCLISDLVAVSDRSNWKPDEFRIYMDAALLVKNTCQRMMETTADEQVSLRRPASGTLLQILLVYIRTLRLVLELYSLLNSSKPAELSEWSTSLCSALKAFVTEATRDLLDFHELLSQKLPPARTEEEAAVDGNGQDVETDENIGEEEGQMWNWRGNEDANSGDYTGTFVDDHQRAEHHTGENDDNEDAGLSERGGVIVIQNPPCLSQYLQSTSFSDNHEGSCLHGLVIPSGPDYRYASLYDETPRHDTDSRSDAEPSTRSYPVRTSATTDESSPSTDEETYRQMEDGYPADTFRLAPHDGSSNELTAEELDIFHSMLSPSTFQLLRENVLAPTAHEENIMLALSVQMASRVYTETSSSGAFNGMVYNGEPVQAEETFDVLVNRSSPTLLDDLVQLYLNAPTKLLHSRLNVVFEGEPGVDGGALSREFFCLIFRALLDRTVKDRSVFEGDRGHLLPAVDHVLSEAKVFWIVGVLVAQAACNGCHGLPGLSPAVRQFLANGARVSLLEEISQLTTLEDVADLDLRSLLKKVKEREELDEEEKTNLEMWLNRSGFSFVMSKAKTDEAIRRILRYYVFESRMSQLVAIAEGMEELGWRPIPSGFDVEIVFPSGEEISLEDLYRCLLINETPAWRSRDLQRAFLFFRKLCTELHEGKIDRLHLSNLLHFFTGAPYLKSGTNITFSHPDNEVIYPQARTCNLELIIPTLHKTYDDFKAAFSQALLLGSYGFGFA